MRSSRLIFSLSALLGVAVGTAVRAADNYVVRDGNGAAVTIRAKDCGSGVLCPVSVPIAPDGTPYTTSAGQPVTVVGPVPLPSGAATAAAQATGNSSLASIEGKTPGLVSGRVPVDGSGVVQPTDTVVRATSTSRSVIIPVGGASAAVVAGGTGHAVGDLLTVSGGTCSTQPRFAVSAVSSGAVTAVTLNTAGSCTVVPTSPAATTSSGAGTGATLTSAYASIATQIMPANASRRGFQVQPQGGTAYLSGIANATADHNALKLPADAL